MSRMMMTRFMGAAIALPLLVLGCNSYPTLPDNARLGHWTGEQVELLSNESKTQLRFVCMSMEFDRPLVINPSDGSFAMEGKVVYAPSLARIGTGPLSLWARITGVAVEGGKRLEFKVSHQAEDAGMTDARRTLHMAEIGGKFTWRESCVL